MNPSRSVVKFGAQKMFLLLKRCVVYCLLFPIGAAGVYRAQSKGSNFETKNFTRPKNCMQSDKFQFLYSKRAKILIFWCQIIKKLCNSSMFLFIVDNLRAKNFFAALLHHSSIVLQLHRLFAHRQFQLLVIFSGSDCCSLLTNEERIGFDKSF